MYTFKNTIKISDLRKHTAEVIEEIQEIGEPVTIISRSEPKVVIMSYERYEALDKSAQKKEKGPITEGIDFFINPPEDVLIKGKFDAVKEIRKLRGYED